MPGLLEYYLSPRLAQQQAAKEEEQQRQQEYMRAVNSAMLPEQRGPNPHQAALNDQLTRHGMTGQEQDYNRLFAPQMPAQQQQPGPVNPRMSMARQLMNSGNPKAFQLGLSMYQQAQDAAANKPVEAEDWKTTEAGGRKYFYRPSDPEGTMRPAISDDEFAKANYEAPEETLPMAGTGIEAQMINIVLDDSIPDDDPLKKIAKQRLERERTMPTPEGTYVIPGYDLGALDGTAAPDTGPRLVKKQPTEGEKTAGGFHYRMSAATKIIDGIRSADYDPTSLYERARGLTPWSSSEENQRYKQAAGDWIRAKLRKESGAVIGEDEMAAEYESYFPQVGDKPGTVKQKREARARATEAMKTNAGRSVNDSPASQGWKAAQAEGWR